jgi:hypothetical protein
LLSHLDSNKIVDNVCSTRNLLVSGNPRIAVHDVVVAVHEDGRTASEIDEALPPIRDIVRCPPIGTSNGQRKRKNPELALTVGTKGTLEARTALRLHKGKGR